MKIRDTNHVADCHDLCPRQVRDFVVNLSRTLSPTFPVHCNGLNSTRATQMGLSRTFHRLCRKHLDKSRIEMVCIHDFPRWEVSAKVGLMELGLKRGIRPMPCVFMSVGRN